MADTPTIKLEISSAQRLDQRFDDGNLETGVFVRQPDSTDMFIINPDATFEQWAAFKSSFNDFATKIQNPPPGSATFNYVQFNLDLQNYNPEETPAPELEDAPANAESTEPVDASDSDSIATTQNQSQTNSADDGMEVTATTQARETARVATAPYLTRDQLNRYLSLNAHKDNSLVHYLELVYARAAKNHPHNPDQIFSDDLNIPGVGSQRHMRNIVAYFLANTKGEQK